MADYILSCCSTANLSREHFAARDISYICFHYELDGKQYADDLGQSMPFDRFYQAMANGAQTKTSQVNAAEFIDYFAPFLEAGKDVLHVCLSSGISGVYNSACMARDELSEKFPERKIYVVDSLGASSGYGLLMDRLADLRDEGKSIDEVRDWAEANKLRVHHWFFSTDLTFYVRGGRISKAAGWFGTALNICPLLNMDNLGRLIPRFKIRGKKRVIAEIEKENGSLRRGSTGLQRQVLHFELRLRGRCACGGRDHRVALCEIEREGRDQFHRHDDRQPHRPRDGRAVLLRRRTQRVNEKKGRFAKAVSK